MINADATRRLTTHSLATALVASVAIAALPVPGEPASRPKPPPPRYLFAGVAWMVPADTAVARLVDRGYREVPAAGDRDQIVCRGRLFEHDAIITGHLDEQRQLLRWVILVAPRGDAYKWPDMRAVFTEVTREAEARYGAPRSVTEKFRFPYERGDTREDEALRDGLATVRRGWSSKSGDKLTVEMGADVSVILTYECEAWADLDKRRRAKRASDL